MKRKEAGSATEPAPSPKRYTCYFMSKHKAESSFSSFFYHLRRGIPRTVPKILASRAAAHVMPNSSTRTRAHTGVAPSHPPHEYPDEVSVTNSEVESAMNHCRLRETLRTPAFSEQEFTALGTVDAYIRGTRDGLTGVARLFSKDIQVRTYAIFNI